MKSRTIVRLLTCIFMGLARLSFAGNATQPAVTLPLSTVKPPPIRPFTRAEAEQWMAPFQHTPFSQAGFNALLIPFHFASPDHTGDSSEAETFACLLSDNLDWSPGNYCARHAYFVFQEDTAAMLQLRNAYDPLLISTLVRGWRATHAIGGMLVHTAKGYHGTLKIFDAAGVPLRSIDYVEPRSFFELLGDMTVDAMTALDQKPSDPLAAFLHKPIGTRPESLVILGKGAFTRRASKEDFDRYNAVLKQDPTFAPVRHWYAVQKYFSGAQTEEDLQASYVDTAIALRDRLNPGYFVNMNPTEMKDKALGSKYDEWVATAQALAGTDVPDLLDAQWRHRWAETSADTAQVLHAYDVASHHPNNGNFLDTLSRQFGYLGGPFCDENLAIALKLTALQSRFLPGVDHRSLDCANIGEFFGNSGHWIFAASFAKEALELNPNELPAKRLLIETDVQLGLYQDALDLAKRNPELVDDQSGGVANCLAFAYATLGDAASLEQFLASHPDPLPRYSPRLYQTYLEILRGTFAGDAVSIKTRWDQLLKEPRAEWGDICVVLCQADILRRSRNFEQYLSWAIADKPSDRRLWILYDQYRHLIPDPKGDDFYFAMSRLYPEDAWCQEAARSFAKAAPHAAHVDPARVEKTIARFPTLRWPVGKPQDRERAQTDIHALYPWFAASAVFQKLDAGDAGAARDLACRYHVVTAISRLGYAEAYVNQLIHITEEGPSTQPSQLKR